MSVLGSGIAMLMCWLVASTWSPFIEAPGSFLRTSAGALALMALASAAVRALTRRVWLGSLAIAVVALGFLQWRFEEQGSLWRSVGRGAVAINTHEAPVAAEHVATAPFLAFCAVVLALAVELFAAGTRHAAVTGLPLLLAVTVPVSTLLSSLRPAPMLAAFACFALLLALEHAVQSQSERRDSSATDSRLGLPTIGVRTLVGSTITVMALVVGLIAAGTLPLGKGLEVGTSGEGRGSSRIAVDNPVVEMRRGLVNQSTLDLLTVTTEGETPRYLRLAVLDEFTGEQWQPGKRRLPRSNRVSMEMPPAPGLRANAVGRTSTWDIRYGQFFTSNWLATPYPYTSVDIASGDFRYDDKTLDLFDVDSDADAPYDGYAVTAFTPEVSAESLDASGTAPENLLRSMTKLPKDMPDVIDKLALEVTEGARSDYQRVAALQQWFRKDGGFEYSLWEGRGSGMSGLVRFLTEDKVGYCQQFATAMAVMSRSLGVPSRVVVGFGRPTRQLPSGEHVFTGQNLHAWTEIYFEGTGWVAFDPTPAVQSGSAPPYSRGLDRAPDPAPATSTPSAQPQRPSARPDPVNTPTTDSSESAPVWPWVVLAALLVVAMLPRLTRSVVRRRRLAHLRDPHRPLAESLDAGWQELRATIVDHRLPWPASTSPRRTLTALQRTLDLDKDQRAETAQLTALVEVARYGRDGALSESARAEMAGLLTDLVGKVPGAVGSDVRRRARWLPSSLWQRQENPDDQ